MQTVLGVVTQLGHVLRSARRAADLTQAALAARTGLNQSRISTIESQPGRMTMDECAALLAALDLELVVRTRSESTPSGEW